MILGGRNGGLIWDPEDTSKCQHMHKKPISSRALRLFRSVTGMPALLPKDSSAAVEQEDFAIQVARSKRTTERGLGPAPRGEPCLQLELQLALMEHCHLHHSHLAWDIQATWNRHTEKPSARLRRENKPDGCLCHSKDPLGFMGHI